MCFGLFADTHEQIGFARVVTDHVFFGYIMDVIIMDKTYRGMGLGKKMISHLMEDEIIKNLKTLALKTKDATSSTGDLDLLVLEIHPYDVYR